MMAWPHMGSLMVLGMPLADRSLFLDRGSHVDVDVDDQDSAVTASWTSAIPVHGTQFVEKSES
jgi:hypothetical protein